MSKSCDLPKWKMDDLLLWPPHLVNRMWFQTHEAKLFRLTFILLIFCLFTSWQLVYVYIKTRTDMGWGIFIVLPTRRLGNIPLSHRSEMVTTDWNFKPMRQIFQMNNFCYCIVCERDGVVASWRHLRYQLEIGDLYSAAPLESWGNLHCELVSHSLIIILMQSLSY